MEVILTDRFLQRVEKCSDYTALDNIPIAVKWARDVFEGCKLLKSHPQSGRVVPEFDRPEIRELLHGHYWLVYEIKTDRIDMLTIWHTSQQLPTHLE
ncbi:MAG TPA: type II toxin-antitoxin system RelE/ParE family toxin [Balneolales bacterium]|nr:type II toxin-antitoxin system RelE/ParE family toxin [Balneolales bacterium]